MSRLPLTVSTPATSQPSPSSLPGTAVTALAHWSPPPPRGPASTWVHSIPSGEVQMRASVSPLASSEPTTMNPSGPAAQASATWLPAPPNDPSGAVPTVHRATAPLRWTTLTSWPPVAPFTPTATAVSSGPTHTSLRRWRPGPPIPGDSPTRVLPSSEYSTMGSVSAPSNTVPTAMNPSPRGAAPLSSQVPDPPAGDTDSGGSSCSMATMGPAASWLGLSR